MKKLLTLSLIMLFVAVGAFAQSRTNRLFRPCSGSATPAKIEIQRDGDIDIVPCSGRDTLVNGVVISPTITFSGASRTDFFPFFSTQTNLAKSPFSWTGTAYEWNNTALDSDFLMQFTPDDSTGDFRVGSVSTYIDVNTAGMNLFSDGTVGLQGSQLNVNGPLSHDVSGNTNFSATDLDFTFTAAPAAGAGSFVVSVGETGQIKLGDDAGVERMYFRLDRTSKTFLFQKSSGDAIFDLTGVGTFSVLRTITPGGTTGDQTINRPAGTVNLAGAAAAITITNNTVSATSLVFTTVRTADATCTFVKSAVPAAGSVVITMNAACTAETSIGFLVLN